MSKIFILNELSLSASGEPTSSAKIFTNLEKAFDEIDNVIIELKKKTFSITFSNEYETILHDEKGEAFHTLEITTHDIRPNNEFSIKDEIRETIETRGYGLTDLNLDINTLYEEIIQNELLLEGITLSIYNTLQEKLQNANLSNEKLTEDVLHSKQNLLRIVAQNILM